MTHHACQYRLERAYRTTQALADALTTLAGHIDRSGVDHLDEAAEMVRSIAHDLIELGGSTPPAEGKTIEEPSNTDGRPD